MFRRCLFVLLSLCSLKAGAMETSDWCRGMDEFLENADRLMALANTGINWSADEGAEPLLDTAFRLSRQLNRNAPLPRDLDAAWLEQTMGKVERLIGESDLLSDLEALGHMLRHKQALLNGEGSVTNTDNSGNPL